MLGMLQDRRMKEKFKVEFGVSVDDWFEGEKTEEAKSSE